MKRILSAAMLLAVVAMPATAFAHVSVGVGINLGGPGYYPPPVAYAAPPPVVYYSPPPVVYAPPPPVIYAPPLYGPYYRRPHCWWQGGYRVCR